MKVLVPFFVFVFAFFIFRVPHVSSNCVKMRIGRWWKMVKQNFQIYGDVFHIYQKHEMDIWKILQTFLFSNMGIPSTPQHTDSHPCTPTPPDGARSQLAAFSLISMRISKISKYFDRFRWNSWISGSGCLETCCRPCGRDIAPWGTFARSQLAAISSIFIDFRWNSWVSLNFQRFRCISWISELGCLKTWCRLCGRDVAPRKSLLHPSWQLFHQFS